MSETAQLALIAMLGAAFTGVVGAAVTVLTAAIGVFAVYLEARRGRIASENAHAVAVGVEVKVNGQKEALLNEIAALKQIIADAQATPPTEQP